MNIKIPDTPYMIALGTSHTAGECDDYKNNIDETYADKIANELNLKLIKIGIPGCINEELSYIFLRLQNQGLLKNKNLKFFLLEPRLTESSLRIGLDCFYSKEDTTEILEHYATNKVGFSFNDDAVRPYRIISEYISFVMNDKSSVDEKINNISKLINERTKKEYKVNPDIKLIINDYIKHSLHYTDSYSELFSNMIHIEMILNALSALHIPTAWIAFDELYTKKQKDTNRNLLISNYFKNTKSTLILDGICNKYMNEFPDLLCSCGHLNEKGHDYLYTEIIDKIKERFYDKTT